MPAPPVAVSVAPADHELHVEVARGVRLSVLHFASEAAVADGTILFVPGFLSFRQSWDLVLRELRRRFHVYYVESREKRSSVVHRGARFTLHELVADLSAVVRALDLRADGFHVVASCSGAATVLRGWVERGLRPSRMVWVAPVLRSAVPWIIVPLAFLLRGPLYPLLQRLAVVWYRRVLNPPWRDPFQHSRFMDVVRSADPFKVGRGARDAYGFRVDVEDARRVEAPVLVLAASRDRAHSFAEVRVVAARLPHGELVDLQLFWRTRTPAAARLMGAFLRGASAGAPLRTAALGAPHLEPRPRRV